MSKSAILKLSFPSLKDQHPILHSPQLLIGFEGGTIVQWDLRAKKADFRIYYDEGLCSHILLIFIMDLVSWSLNAIDQIFSTGRQGKGEPSCPDGTFFSG
ncbi:hypothetical protein AMECASPLE_039382 [Ameca splendens]|uniref:Uncharacterized protein n=1 Tax=Ameca splendens TaxID=208324 RepID=A0ABV1AFQ6_9TELE